MEQLDPKAQPGTGWLSRLPGDKEAQTLVPPLSPCPVVSDSICPWGQHWPCPAGRESTALPGGWTGTAPPGMEPWNAAEGTKFSRAERIVCCCWQLRAGKSQRSSNGTSPGVSWSGDTSSGQAGASLVEEEGRRKVMSCSRATTPAL